VRTDAPLPKFVGLASAGLAALDTIRLRAFAIRPITTSRGKVDARAAWQLFPVLRAKALDGVTLADCGANEQPI
jgi:hypothetical protein